MRADAGQEEVVALEDLVNLPACKLIRLHEIDHQRMGIIISSNPVKRSCG